jgi:hypothetical protein
MPWIEGPTWVEVMLEKRPLTPQQALDLARAFADILSRMEQNGIAHCDLSGPNVLLPMLAGQTADRRPQTAYSPSSTVELVDVEGLYAPGLPRPEALPSGSSGYAHRTAREGLWGPTADRFAGAVLLAEMLGWGDETVREACYGETYFDPAEMPAQGGANPPRYRTLIAALARHYGQPVADLFERAWTSETLADCPTFGEWLVALPEHPVAQAFSLSAAATETAEAQASTSPEEVTLGVVRGLMQAARRMEDKGNLEGALELYRQALELAQADPSLRSLAREIELTVQDVEKRVAAQASRPQPAVEIPAPPSVSPLSLGEEPELREQPHRTSPWGWVVAGLMIFALFVAIVALQQQQAAQATATAIAWQEQSAATARAQATATAQAQATATAQAQATATARAQATVQAYNNHPVISAENAVHLQLHQSIDAHSGWISAIDFSPDGLFLASSAWDHTVKLWRVEYGQLMHYLTIYHHSQVEAVVFSPDGKLLASSGCTTEFSIENPCQKGEINLWSLDGNLVRTIEAHDSVVGDIAFSPDSTILASGADDNNIQLWRVADGALLRTLHGHTDWVHSVAFSPDGAILASGSRDGTIRLWQVTDGRLLHILVQSAQVNNAVFSPDGLWVAGVGVGGDNFPILAVWDVRTGERIYRRNDHTLSGGAIAFNPEGSILATGGGHMDKIIQVRRSFDGQPLKSLSGHEAWIADLAFSPDGRFLVSGSGDGTIKVWMIP